LRIKKNLGVKKVHGYLLKGSHRDSGSLGLIEDEWTRGKVPPP